MLLALPDWVHVTLSPSLALTYPAQIFCPALGDSLLSLTLDSWDPQPEDTPGPDAVEHDILREELSALSCDSDSDVE